MEALVMTMLESDGSAEHAASALQSYTFVFSHVCMCRLVWCRLLAAVEPTERYSGLVVVVRMYIHAQV